MNDARAELGIIGDALDAVVFGGNPDQLGLTAIAELGVRYEIALSDLKAEMRADNDYADIGGEG